VRTAAQAGIDRYLPEPQASLSAGVLLGGTGRLDADFRLQLQRSGLAHVVAIDGFKQVMVAAGLGAVAVRLLGPRAAALPVLLGIAGYTLLTGAHPAAVRAGLMVGLATLAALTGRLADPLTSVLVAATVMAAVDPRILLDVGLQLSLSATLGIVLLWPRVRPRLKGLPHFVAEPAGLTLAVTLATLPVALSAFQLVSLVSPLAHVLAVPLLPVVLLSTALLAVVSPVPPVAGVVAWVAWLPGTLLVDIIEACGNLPGAALSTGRLSPAAAGALAAALLLWGLWDLPEASALRLRLARAAPPGLGYAAPLAALWTPAACLALCLVAALLLQLVRPDGRVHVHSLAQTRGEAVLIRGPTGRTALVVGGRLDGAQLAAQVADHLDVWEHRLDAVLQLDSDAQAGLGLTLARYPAAQQLDAATDARLDLGGGAALDIYAAEAQSSPGVSVSFGRVWLPLAGRPPRPATIDRSQLVPGPGALPAADQVSDGIDVWAAEVRSGPTTFAATPESGD
jgi:competence protein ComEC